MACALLVVPATRLVQIRTFEAAPRGSRDPPKGPLLWERQDGAMCNSLALPLLAHGELNGFKELAAGLADSR